MSFSALFTHIHCFGFFGTVVFESLLSVGLLGGLDRHIVSSSTGQVAPRGVCFFASSPWFSCDPSDPFPTSIPNPPASHLAFVPLPPPPPPRQVRCLPSSTFASYPTSLELFSTSLARWDDSITRGIHVSCQARLPDRAVGGMDVVRRLGPCVQVEE